MENASRALIIAGTVLMGVLLMGIFAYVFRAGSRVSENYDRKQQSEQLELYNSRFELYHKSDNTIMDLITVANLAHSVNEECEYDITNAVEIVINTQRNKIFRISPQKPLDRNEILNGSTDTSNSISIYNLATKNLTDLGLETNNNIFLGTDTLAETKYKDAPDEDGNPIKKTVYKYLFNCTEIGYADNHNGKVSKMVFEMAYNASNWEYVRP